MLVKSVISEIVEDRERSEKENNTKQETAALRFVPKTGRTCESKKKKQKGTGTKGIKRKCNTR